MPAGKSILIIEDDKDFANALHEALTDSGFSVIHSVRFNEATTKLSRQKFSCILIDLQLEGYSGMKLIQYIRNPSFKDGFNTETPIVLMSGHLESNIVRLSAGKVQAVLAKPFDVDTIVNKILSLVETQSAAGLKKTKSTDPRTA